MKYILFWKTMPYGIYNISSIYPTVLYICTTFLDTVTLELWFNKIA